MKYIVQMVIFLLIFIGILYRVMPPKKQNTQIEKQEERSTEITEEFIYQWLQNENGMIATYIQANGELDEDKVQGREILAETLGLIMYYALEKEDEALFDVAYHQLMDYFLEDSGFINWKLKENGTSDVSTNALVDDLRILYALVVAYEKWAGDHYMDTAVLISKYLNKHNVKNNIYTNFYDQEYSYASSDIALSYIDIQGLEMLADRGLLDKKVVANTVQILKEAPLKNGFYPISYHVEEEEYTFNEEVNLIDQAIIAYHYAQVGERSKEFLTFLKEELATHHLINGIYHRKTKQPTVDYESPAIYGFLILYALEIEENELAKQIYERLKEFQVIDKNSKYYGGYSITDGNTHIFDNIIPLLAELEIRKLDNK